MVVNFTVFNVSTYNLYSDKLSRAFFVLYDDVSDIWLQSYIYAGCIVASIVVVFVSELQSDQLL